MRNRVAACFVVLMLLAAACSNSKKATTTENAGGNSGTSQSSGKKVTVNAPGVTDTEIRVGGVASVTNPLGGKYADAFAGVNAYFNMINTEQGGLYGRKLALAAQRDDKVSSNSDQVQALLSQDNVFAVLPVAVLLFTGAQTLVNQNVPTFGWTINTEWEGTCRKPEEEPVRAGRLLPLLHLRATATCPPWPNGSASTRSACSPTTCRSRPSAPTGIRNSFNKWGNDVDAKIVFTDASLSFGTTDLSVQVSKMKDAGVDFVTTCMDLQGVVTLAKETKKQNLKATQYLPNGYDKEITDDFGDLFEGSYVLTFFAAVRVRRAKPPGLTEVPGVDQEVGRQPSENSVNGWLNATLFVDGLKKAGPNFDRQKLIDAINSMKTWTGDGLLRTSTGPSPTRRCPAPVRCAVEGDQREVRAGLCPGGQALHLLRPHLAERRDQDLLQVVSRRARRSTRPGTREAWRTRWKC